MCKEPQGIVTGNQPRGQMTWSSMPSSLPGHYGKLFVSALTLVLQI